MDTEITLQRHSDYNDMNLEDDERALLDEFTIETAPPVKRSNPIKKAKKMRRVAFREEYEDQEPEFDVNAFANPVKSSIPKPPPPQEYDHGDAMEEEDDDSEQGEPGNMFQGGEQPSSGYNSIDDEKADLLNKLTRLEKKGYTVNKRLNAYSPVQDLRTEVKRIMYSIEIEQSVKFSRRTLVACVTGLEFLNKRYNPLEVHLDGWSESVMENLDDYDGVFEDLHNKYKGKMEVAPEVKLLMMLGGSAMMFHLTNSMFKAAIPNMNDVLKQNPDLVNSMMSAVQNTQPRAAPIDPSAAPVSSNGRREMQGPGLDLSSLMGGIMMPPAPPVSSTSISKPMQPVLEQIEQDDAASVSDIVSQISNTESEMKEISTGGTVKRRGRPRGSKTSQKQKKEIAL